MLIFNKIPTRKNYISSSVFKGGRRVQRVRVKRITEDNKKFLRALGFKIKNASNHRFTPI